MERKTLSVVIENDDENECVVCNYYNPEGAPRVPAGEHYDFCDAHYREWFGVCPGCTGKDPLGTNEDEVVECFACGWCLDRPHMHCVHCGDSFSSYRKYTVTFHNPRNPEAIISGMYHQIGGYDPEQVDGSVVLTDWLSRRQFSTLLAESWLRNGTYCQVSWKPAPLDEFDIHDHEKTDPVKLPFIDEGVSESTEAIYNAILRFELEDAKREDVTDHRMGQLGRDLISAAGPGAITKASKE